MKKLLKKIESIIRKIKVFFYLNLKYGTTKPEFVKFPDYDTNVYINTKDWRAIKKLAFDFARGKIGRNIHFWRDFIKYNNPEVCLDIGVNYGECLFSMEYEKNTKIIGIEANPILIPFINKSIKAHYNNKQIIIHNNLVANEPKKDCKFYVNLNWSGKSSAINELNENTNKKEFLIDQITIDSIFENDEQNYKSLLFKLDVEGYEPFVLKGMNNTLKMFEKVIGYIEIDKNFINKIGVSLVELDKQFDDFKLYWPSEKKGKSLIMIDSISSLFSDFDLEHTDIIIIKSKDTNWLPNEWIIK